MLTIKNISAGSELREKTITEEKEQIKFNSILEMDVLTWRLTQIECEREEHKYKIYTATSEDEDWAMPVCTVADAIGIAWYAWIGVYPTYEEFHKRCVSRLYETYSTQDMLSREIGAHDELTHLIYPDGTKVETISYIQVTEDPITYDGPRSPVTGELMFSVDVLEKYIIYGNNNDRGTVPVGI